MNCTGTDIKLSRETPWTTITDEEINRGAAAILDSEVSDSSKSKKILNLFARHIKIIQKQKISIRLLESENEILTQSNEDLLNKTEESAIEHRRLAGECSNFRSTLQDIIRKKRRLESQMKKLVKQNISFSTKSRELMEKVSALTADLNLLSEEFNRLANERNVLQHKFEILDQANQELKKKNERLTADQSKLSDDLAAIEEEKKCLHSSLDEVRIREAKKSIESSLNKEIQLKTIFITSLFAGQFAIPIAALVGGGFFLLNQRSGRRELDNFLNDLEQKISTSLKEAPKPLVYECAAETFKKLPFNACLDLAVNTCCYSYKLMKETQWS